MSGFLALMNAAPEDIDKLSGAIDSCSDTFVKTKDGAIIPMSEALEKGISMALTEMKNKVTEVLAAIKKLFSDTFTEIANIVKNKMADASTNMTNALNTMKTNVSTACSAIRTSVSSYLSMGSDAYQWGRDICIQMAAGINAEAWRVRSAASNLASAVDNTLGFSVPEEGPLSHADEYMPDFMKLMAEGIRKNAKVVMSAVRSLSDSMSGVFTGLSIPEVNAGQLAQEAAQSATPRPSTWAG